MKKISYKVAVGGVISSLCLVMMFLTGVFPLLGMAIPIYSGTLLLIVADEADGHWAGLSYFAVSALSLFITPDKEAALLFIMLFGYYPVMRRGIQKGKLAFAVKWLIKFAVFNAAIIASYWMITNVLGIYDLIDEFGFLGEHLKLKLMIFANVTFVLYDQTIGILEEAYKKWFRQDYLRKR